MKLYLLTMAAAIAFTACNNPSTNDIRVKSASTTEADNTEDMVSKGRYLVLAGGCNDCHSPKNFGPNGPMLDTTRVLSGHPANAPLPPINANATKPGNWIQMAPD